MELVFSDATDADTVRTIFQPLTKGWIVAITDIDGDPMEDVTINDFDCPTGMVGFVGETYPDGKPYWIELDSVARLKVY